MLKKLSASISAAAEIYAGVSELAMGLKIATAANKQIIVIERSPDFDDFKLLNIIRTFPTIVIDERSPKDYEVSKKHPYWKANAFILGTRIEDISYELLKMSIESLLPATNSFEKLIPWNSARKCWTPELDFNRKLSDVAELFLQKTCPTSNKHQEIVNFSKFIQNRGKGRGTFKTIRIELIAETNRLKILATLDWHNKSEQSLKTLYQGLSKCDYESASINIVGSKLLEISAVWLLGDSATNHHCFFLIGLPGVKVDKVYNEMKNLMEKKYIVS